MDATGKNIMNANLSAQNFLGECIQFCKEELEVESVTVVTNGSKVI